VGDEFQIDSLCANVIPEDIKSKKLLERLGFCLSKEVLIDNKKYDQLLLNL